MCADVPKEWEGRGGNYLEDVSVSMTRWRVCPRLVRTLLSTRSREFQILLLAHCQLANVTGQLRLLLAAVVCYSPLLKLAYDKGHIPEPRGPYQGPMCASVQLDDSV